MVRTAQSSKPAIGRLVDKVSAIFVPSVMIVAVITFLAWVNFGHGDQLVTFAIVATMILQEMAARLGIITQKGLGETLRHSFQGSVFKWPLFVLIIVALYVGNAAYEGGNLSGAAMGVKAIANGSQTAYTVAVVALFIAAAGLLWSGSYKRLEKILIGLIVLMAFASNSAKSSSNLCVFSTTRPVGSISLPKKFRMAWLTASSTSTVRAFSMFTCEISL